MANVNDRSCRKYGVPLYGAAWVPPSLLAADSKGDEESAVIPHVVLAGGGGEGSSGIPNALLLSAFDSDSNALPDEPVARLGTGSDLPYRIAVHPGGEGVICSLPCSCRWFEWEAVTEGHNRTLNLKSSEKVLDRLEDVGQQLAMTFCKEGNLLAVGGEDGKLRGFKWPTMEPFLDEEKAHSSVKDLDFSWDGKLLVSLGSGPGRVWNVSTSAAIATLPRENDEILGFCRFSQTTDSDQVLYTTAMRDRGGFIIMWDATSWKRKSSKHVVKDPISAFSVSPDGKLLAVGTIQGDIVILSSRSMRVQSTLKGAHMGLVTALAFSPDSSALLSASLDASSRVTLIRDKKDGTGTSFQVIFFIIVLLIAVGVWYVMLRAKI